MNSNQQIRRTLCNRDCPDACGLLATVQDGKIIALTGDPTHPVTQGFLCPRTRRFPLRQNAKERLTSPLIRKDGQLQPATFEEAINLVAERLVASKERHGPQAVCHHRGGGNLGQLMSVTDLFWSAFGPVTTIAGDICSGAGNAAQRADFGAVDSNDLHDS